MIEESLIDVVDWGARRSVLGGSAFVPSAIRDLLSASSEADAEEAYWRLDNRVVVQGQLFESARWVIGPLVVGLARESPGFVRVRVVNLFVEIAYGGAHEDEPLADGELDLAMTCQEELRGGLWLFYGLLDDAMSMVRLGALDLLDVVERDRVRLAAAIQALAVDVDANVARRARDIIEGSRPGGPHSK